MWPWGHVIVGYLAYSLLSHLLYRDSPNGSEAIAVVAGSLGPDLIDKPLAWEFGVFDSGYALGHSILVALPASLALCLLADRVGRVRAGIAFAVGYLLHLPGDVLYAYVHADVVHLENHLWPFGEAVAVAEPPGFRDQVTYFLQSYREELAGGGPSTYLLVQLGLAGFVLALWLYDGAPILRECVVAGKRFGSRLLTGT